MSFRQRGRQGKRRPVARPGAKPAGAKPPARTAAAAKPAPEPESKPAAKKAPVRKTPARRPPPRKKAEPVARSAPVEPVDDLSLDLATPEPVAKAPEESGERTVAAKPVASEPGTVELSLGGAELVSDDSEPVARAPVEAPTVVAKSTPMVASAKKTLKFNNTGDRQRYSGFTFEYVGDAGAEGIRIQITGGERGGTTEFYKGQQASLINRTSDGTPVNLIFNYIGTNLSGAKEVDLVVEGQATTLAATVGRVRSGASSAMEAAPSKWRHIPEVLGMALSGVVMYFGYTMPGVRDTLGKLGQHAAVIGTAATVFGLSLWSMIERLRHNQNIRN